MALAVTGRGGDASSRPVCLTPKQPFGTVAQIAPVRRAGSLNGHRIGGMTKSDLIKRLAEANPHLYLRDIERIVGTVFEQISAALARGDRVELRGFGAFSVRARAERIGRNPRTGDEVAVPNKIVPYFKTGKELRERLNPPK